MSDAPAPQADEKNASVDGKVRKDLVQVFFGLVLGQIAVYVASLVEVWKPETLEYWSAWSHIVLAFALTTTSWFGWQMSVQKAKLKEEASVFQVGFALSILDILLVTLYFLLVHQVELSGVSAFPPQIKPQITKPDAASETLIILAIFGIYTAWDTVRLIFKEVQYGPWPSVACFVLSLMALIPTFGVAPVQPYCVIWIDLYLMCLVFLFRALKRLQKWSFNDNRARFTIRFLAAPPDILVWAYILFGCLVILYLVTLAPLARGYVCGT